MGDPLRCARPLGEISDVRTLCSSNKISSPASRVARLSMLDMARAAWLSRRHSQIGPRRLHKLPMIHYEPVSLTSTERNTPTKRHGHPSLRIRHARETQELKPLDKEVPNKHPKLPRDHRCEEIERKSKQPTWRPIMISRTDLAPRSVIGK